MRQPSSPAPGVVLRRWASLLLVIVLLAAGGVYAYATIFSRFFGYDDEGMMMRMIQFMLDGRRIYNDIQLSYGPTYFGLRWVIHGALGVALTNDNVRMVTLAIWLLAAVMLSGAVYRICRGLGWALGAACLCFASALLHLHDLTHEPGHPADTVAALMALAVLAATFGSSTRRRGVLLALGAITAGLFFTKANIGVFFLASLTLALLIDTPAGPLWFLIRGAAFLLALSMPAVILRTPLLDYYVRYYYWSVWAVVFAAAATLGLALCWVVGRAAAGDSRTRLSDLLWPALGAALATLALLAFAVGQGNTLGGIINSLCIKPLHVYSSGLIDIPVPIGRLTGLWLIAGAVAAVLYLCAPGRLKTVYDSVAIPALKLALGAAMLLPQWLLLGDFSWPMKYAHAFLWLTLVSPPQRAPGAGELLFRRVLCFGACLQVLQMYPIAGTHRWIGTMLFVPIAALWVSDGLQALAAQRRTGEGRTAWLSRPAWASRVMAAAAVLMLGFYATLAWRAYRRNDPVRLPGCALMRISEIQAGAYRCLADTVRASCDTFVPYYGLQSLYFWSGTRPIGYVVPGSSWDGLSPAENAAIVASYRGHTQMLWIDHPGVWGPPKTDIPFIDMVHRDFRPAARVDFYSIWVPKERHGDLQLRSCAWLVKPQASDNPDTARLELCPPQGASLDQITRVEAVDLFSEQTLADTASTQADLRAQLVKAPDQTCPWQLLMPRPKVPWTQLSSPALRFYTDGRRVLTIPIAVDLAP